MLSAQQNKLITQTDRGTPCGELMRRYWQPVALAEEVSFAGGPLPVRVFNEDLALFRDADEGVGLLGLHCPHRGTDLSYARIEQGGLRCLYHGWLFDKCGRCLDQPSEPPEYGFKDKVQHLAYPCQERAGVVFAYFGPGDPPLLPDYEFLSVPQEYRWAYKLWQDCNYLQGNEGNIDPQHLSFLHNRTGGDEGADSRWSAFGSGLADISVEETDFGCRIYAVRPHDEHTNHVRVSHFIMPNLTAFPAEDGYSVHWHVPVDDTHHWKYIFHFQRSKPIDGEAHQPRVIGDLERPYHQRNTRANRYLQDRTAMNSSFSGIGPDDFQAQDRFATESQGAIQNRTTERLGVTDRPIIVSRQILLAAIEDVEAGREPRHVIREPTADLSELVVRQDILPRSANHQTYWKATAGVA